MKPPENQPAFGAGFMDDYFAEAEEHIVTVRRSLLTLEGALGSELPAAVLEELFRSCHSLKGISAMVELREAEMLAHHMESCLRAVRNHQVALTPANFEALVVAGRTLETVVAAHRAGTPLPDIEEPIRQLQALSTPDGSADSNGLIAAETPQAALAGAARAPVPRWKVTFVPSPELVARGVKVDTVRARLLEIGQVLRVVPKVTAGGGIAFEFELQTSDESKLAAWGEDGLAYEPMATAASDVPGVPAQGTPSEAFAAGTTNFVRVDLSRLDDLMRLVGDMVVARARLADTLERVEEHVPFREWRALQEHNAGLERRLRDLREGVMRVRLVPVGEIFRRMPFVVRDLARDYGKRARLDLAGGSTEIDKFLIERMMDPVIHLVRNAISHGIEAPGQRVAAGKPAEGVIRLGASTSGESIVVEISDDGAGIDVPAVMARGRATGLPVPDGPGDMRGLLDLLCASGFSTREQADRASGRGVGMAVVRSTVRELGGLLALDTAPGRGTTFRVTLPLTLAITDAIIAQVGDQVFAVPQSAVMEVIEVDAAALRQIERNELLTYRGGTLPIARLSRLFGIESEDRPRFHAIVVGTGLAAVGLMVDRITGQREIVVKTITDPLLRVDGISGATELGDGRLVLILDAQTLRRMQTGRQPQSEGTRV
jgi:two-component system chemotaxis sensor kinase CheA